MNVLGWTIILVPKYQDIHSSQLWFVTLRTVTVKTIYTLRELG